EAFDEFLTSRQEPEWLTAARRNAWGTFQELPLPGRADEEWMRTDIRLFRLDKFAPPGSSTAVRQLPEHALMGGVKFAGTTAALDSRPVSVDFTHSTKKQGVLFGSLDDLVRDHGDLIRRHLFRAVNQRADKFAALHAACWSGGSILYIPRGVVIDE